MFTLQIHTLDQHVLNAFARTFSELAALGKNPPLEMTGAQYIDALDRPDAGVGQPKSAAAVFTAGIIDNTPAPGTAAAVFAVGNTPLAGGTIVHVPAAPQYVMTELAAFTRDEYASYGWSDQQLIDAKLMLPPAPQAAAVFDPSNAPNVAGGVTGIAPATSAQTSASTPAAPPPAPQNTGANAPPPMLDAAGMPWDARIHASTRTTTQKGIWKARKGVDAATVAQVTAEIMQRTVATPAVPFTPLNTPAAPPPAPAPTSPAGAPAAPPPPPASAPTQPPPPPGAAMPAVVNDFVSLSRYATHRATVLKNLTAPQIIATCEAHGMPGLGMVSSRPDLVPAIYADLEAIK